MALPLEVTAEQLLELSPPHKRTELVRGRMIVREPAGYRHGDIAARVLIAIGIYLANNPIGRVFAAETGFTLERKPDTVRAPDVAFIKKERLLAPAPLSFAEIAPDLVVEVLSPGDRAGEVLAKIADWLNAGCALVWVVDAERQLARIYRADGSATLLNADESLAGEDLLPGFALPLASLFA